MQLKIKRVKEAESTMGGEIQNFCTLIKEYKTNKQQNETHREKNNIDCNRHKQTTLLL